MPTAIIFYVLKAEKRRDLDVLGIKKEGLIHFGATERKNEIGIT